MYLVLRQVLSVLFGVSNSSICVDVLPINYLLTHTCTHTLYLPENRLVQHEWKVPLQHSVMSQYVCPIGLITDKVIKV